MLINEHFEPVFNAAMATQVIFQRFLRYAERPVADSRDCLVLLAALMLEPWV
jgi:hypothetical protein